LKKFFAILLITLLLFDTGGLIILFRIQQETIREEAEKFIDSKLPSENIYLIIVNRSDLNSASGLIFKREKKEFWYKDKLYDVVKVKESRDRFYIYCLNDQEEESILNGICAFVNHNQDNKLISLIYLPYYFAEEYMAFTPCSRVELIGQCEHNYYKSIPTSIPTPPPRFS
jgi:hypothetical protein